MGDTRFSRFYDRIAGAHDRAREIKRLSDEEAASALAAASRGRDPLLANVLATELMNRMRRKDALLAHVMDGMIATDAEGRVTAASPAVRKMLGWGEEALRGRDLHHTLCYRAPDGDFIRRDACPIAQTLRDGTPRQGHAHLIRQDGSLLPATFTVAAVVQEGVRVGAVLAFQDAQRLVERLQEEKEQGERYRRLVERGPAYMYVASLGDAHETAWMCPQFEATLGFPPEDWAHDTDLEDEHIHPQDRARVQRAWRESVRTGRRFAAEYRIQTGDGRVRWLRDEAVATHTAAGRPVKFFGAMLDITEEMERHLAEARRREELERIVFGLAKGVTAAATFVFRPDGQLTFANEAAERIFGRSFQELAATPYAEWSAFLRAPDGSRLDEDARPLRRAMREGRPAQGVLLAVLRPDGTRSVVRADAVPVRDPQTREVMHVVGTFVEQPSED